MAAKQDIFIKEGEILRGPEATEELCVKDMNEIIKESGLEPAIEAASSKNESTAENVPATEDENPNDLIEKIVKKAGLLHRIKLQATKLVPTASASVEPVNVTVKKVSFKGVKGDTSSKLKVSACGASVKGATVSGNGLEYDVGIDVGVAANTANVKALNVSMKAGSLDCHASATGTVEAVSVKALNVSMTAGSLDSHASATGTVEAVSVKAGNLSGKIVHTAVNTSATATAKAFDLKAGNLDVTGANIAFEAEAVATAKGADVKVVDAQCTGLQVTAKAEAQAKAVGADVNAASVRAVGYRVHRGAGASAEATGLDVKAATANIVGVEDKKEVTCQVQAVGSEVRAANLSITGEKKGASAEAAVNVQGAHVQTANVNIQGKDSSVGAQATLHACAGSVRAANVDVAPQGGTNFQATADFTAGIDVGNVAVGTHKGGGIGISTRFQVGNVGLTAGPPNLILGPGLNVGLGGGGGSSSSGKKSKGKGTKGHTGGNVDHGNAYTTDQGCGEPAKGMGTASDQHGRGTVGNGSSNPHTMGGMGDEQRGSASVNAHLFASGSSMPNSLDKQAGSSMRAASGSSGQYTTDAGLREPRPMMRKNYPNRAFTADHSFMEQHAANSEHGRSPQYAGAGTIGQSNTQPSMRDGPGSPHTVGRVGGEQGGPPRQNTHHFSSGFSASGTPSHHTTDAGQEPKLMVYAGYPKQHTTYLEHGRSSQYSGTIGQSNTQPNDGVGFAGRMYSAEGSSLRRRATRSKDDDEPSTTHRPSKIVRLDLSKRSESHTRYTTGKPIDSLGNRFTDMPSFRHAGQGRIHQHQGDPTKLGTATGSTMKGASGSQAHQQRDGTDQGIDKASECDRLRGEPKTQPREKYREGHVNSAGIASSPDQHTMKGVYTSATDHHCSTQLSCPKRSHEQLHNDPSPKQGIVDQDNDKANDADTKETSKMTRSGFGNTRRRGLHTDSTSTSHSNIQGTGDYFGASNNGLEPPTSDKEVHSKPQTYGQSLASALGEKVRHLRPDKPKEKSESKSRKTEIPSSREEAKRELKRRMKAFKKDIDEIEAQKQSQASGAGSAGSSLGTQPSEGAAENDAQESSTAGPNKRPFGSKRNIYTLDCFQNESSRQVKTLRGKVHGFEA